MSDLTPIEGHVRAGEVLDPEAALVIRGWPLTVDGLLRNADATRRRTRGLAARSSRSRQR